MSTRIIGLPPELPAVISTQEEATHFLERELNELAAMRLACDVVIPDDREATVRKQTLAWQRTLFRVGYVQGLAGGFFRAGLLPPAAYTHFHAEALTHLAAKLVGVT
jgi:hypothetical protein